MPDLDRVDAEALGTLGDVTRRIFEGGQVGIVVRGVLSPELCAETVRRLEDGACTAHTHPYYPGTTFGQVLLTADRLTPYFEAARELERTLPPEVLKGVTRGLRGLSPTHKLAVPRTRRGIYYGAMTARLLPPGSAIAVHAEKPDWKSMEALRDMMDLTTQVSFYVLLQAPEQGGELVLYDDEASAEIGDRAMDELPHTVVHLDVGDMVVFDGGRHNHRVTEVGGTRPRWTLGGFSAFAGRRQYFWS